MSHWIHKHLSLIGYLFLTLAVVAILEWHHNETLSDISRLQRETCTRSTVLAENQRAVISALVSVLEIERDESDHGIAQHVIDQLDQLRLRLDTIPEFDCE